jgi:hypothetical protein
MSTVPRLRVTRRPVALTAVGLLLVTACGDQRTATTRIQDDTAAVVEALNDKDVAAARAALRTLDADLAAAGRLEQLEAATVSELRAGVTKLVADLALLSPPTPTATPTTASPTKAPTKAPPKKKRGKHDD